MALESKNFEVVKKEKISGVHSIECNIEGLNGCSKVLAITGGTDIENTEVSDGKINITGALELCAVYISEEDEICTTSMNFPFNYELKDEKVTPDCKDMLSARLVKQNIKSATSTDIKVECEISFDGFIVCPISIATVKNEDRDYSSKEDEIKVIKLIGRNCSKLLEEVKGTVKNGVKKILCSKTNVLLKNTEAGVDFVSISGEIETEITYVNADDRFESLMLSDTFKDEVELSGVTRDSIVEAKVSLICSESKIITSEEEKTTSFVVTLPLKACVCAYSEESVEVIKDIYSTKCELSVNTSSFDMLKSVKHDEFESKLSGGLTLSENDDRIDKILFALAGTLEITNCYQDGKEIFLEGIANACVVYLNDDTNSIKSVEISTPFVVSDKAQDVAGDSIITYDVSLCDVDVSVKKGREISLDAKIKGQISYNENEISAVISEVSEGEKYPERDYAMELFFAKSGQSSWDIAKSAKVKEENVIFQNPELVFPLEKDEQILLYFQKLS